MKVTSKVAKTTRRGYTTTFTVDEVKVVNQLLHNVMRDGDLSAIRRSKAFINFYRKMVGMRERMQANG